MGLFTRKQSKNVAKERLKLVLIHDRANCSSEVLEMMRNDIIAVINKYYEVDELGIELNIGTHKADHSNDLLPALYANIPIRNMRTPKAR